MNAGRAAAFSTLLVLQACAEATAPPSTAAGPVALTTQDGLIVSLSVDRPAVATAGELRVHAQVRNTSLASALWWGGDCRVGTAVTVVADDVSDPPTGVAWAGDAGVLKALLLAGSGEPGSPRTVAAGDGTACRVDRLFNALLPDDAL